MDASSKLAVKICFSEIVKNHKKWLKICQKHTKFINFDSREVFTLRYGYGAPTRHTSATLDFKEWRRVFVFLRRFLLTSLCRTRLALTLLWSTRLILTIYRPIFCPENRAFIIYTLYIWSKSAMGSKRCDMLAPAKITSINLKD